MLDSRQFGSFHFLSWTTITCSTTAMVWQALASLGEAYAEGTHGSQLTTSSNLPSQEVAPPATVGASWTRDEQSPIWPHQIVDSKAKWTIIRKHFQTCVLKDKINGKKSEMKEFIFWTFATWLNDLHIFIPYNKLIRIIFSILSWGLQTCKLSNCPRSLGR